MLLSEYLVVACHALRWPRTGAPHQYQGRAEQAGREGGRGCTRSKNAARHPVKQAPLTWPGVDQIESNHILRELKLTTAVCRYPTQGTVKRTRRPSL